MNKPVESHLTDDRKSLAKPVLEDSPLVITEKVAASPDKIIVNNQTTFDHAPKENTIKNIPPSQTPETRPALEADSKSTFATTLDPFDDTNLIDSRIEDERKSRLSAGSKLSSTVNQSMSKNSTIDSRNQIQFLDKMVNKLSSDVYSAYNNSNIKNSINTKEPGRKHRFVDIFFGKTLSFYINFLVF